MDEIPPPIFLAFQLTLSYGSIQDLEHSSQGGRALRHTQSVYHRYCWKLFGIPKSSTIRQIGHQMVANRLYGVVATVLGTLPMLTTCLGGKTIVCRST